jgi:glycosyltransferase involved in cell wall biosynthesis
MGLLGKAGEMRHNQLMKVSVIVTVYHESASIDRLLNSLAAQTRLPDEVVICDGGSQDSTVARIEMWAAQSRLPVRLLIVPGANISQGRNTAIRAAVGSLIAATDAGVRLEATWLEELVAPWAEAVTKGDPAPIAVAGFFVPDVDGAFQSAMAATVLPLVEDIDPAKFLPSSRSVAFTKAAWAAVGGYPEWLDYCEDLIFDFGINALRPEGRTAFVWSPRALVHFRPRTSLRQFWTQYYRYARGDGKADLFRKRHLLRYAVYLVLLPALVGHGLWGTFGRPLGWLMLAGGVVAYCWRPWQRLTTVGRDLTQGERIRAALWVPVIRAVGDIAKIVGYPVGRLWRARNGARIANAQTAPMPTHNTLE